MPLTELPPVADRFLRYVQIDTQSDPDSDSVPSTKAQLRLGELLSDELREMGAADVELDRNGYVYATVPGRYGGEDPRRRSGGGNGKDDERGGRSEPDDPLPVIALLAHQDTSPDEPADGVQPQVHVDYDGGPIDLAGDGSVVLDPEEDSALGDHAGHDLITGDGTTLLGSDDKAGIAIIMQLAERLLSETDSSGERGSAPRPTVRICFTVDEEIGRGVDHLDLDTLGADVAYTLDGGGCDVLYTETFFAAEARLGVEGETVHPGYAKNRMVNALRIVSEFTCALPEGESPERTDEREGYFYPHRTRAADPRRAEVHVLLRDFTPEGLHRRKELIRRQVAALEARYPRAAFDLEIEDQYENMGVYIEEIEPRVVTVAQRAADSMGIDLRLDHVRGGTDGSRLSARGLPTPNVFTGGHAFHSRKEWNTVQNLRRALAFSEELIYAWGAESVD